MAWWIWMLVGLFCLVAETATAGGIVFLFFGAAALLVGGLVALGVGGPLGVQVVLFSALSIIAIAFLRRPLLRMLARHETGEPVETLVGQSVVLRAPLGPGATGQADMRGTVWSVKNCGSRTLQAGEACPIIRVDGLTLCLDPDAVRAGHS